MRLNGGTWPHRIRARCHRIRILTLPLTLALTRCDWGEAPWLHRYCKPCRPQLKSAEQRDQRDRTMAVARLALDPNDDTHERMLMAIYCTLTGDATWPPRYGAHWEVVGFQGNDPATDLRGVGMLALLQVLHFQKTQPKLLASIYRLSRGERDFPFMTVSITMTQLSLQALRSGALTRLANRSEAKGGEHVYETVHAFHHACYLYMYTAWQQRGLSIVDFGFLKKEIAQIIHRKPAMLMRALDAHGATQGGGKGGKGGKSGSFVEFG